MDQLTSWVKKDDAYCYGGWNSRRFGKLFQATMHGLLEKGSNMFTETSSIASPPRRHIISTQEVISPTGRKSLKQLTWINWIIVFIQLHNFRVRKRFFTYHLVIIIIWQKNLFTKNEKWQNDDPGLVLFYNISFISYSKASLECNASTLNEFSLCLTSHCEVNLAAGWSYTVAIEVN